MGPIEKAVSTVVVVLSECGMRCVLPANEFEIQQLNALSFER